MELKRVCTTFNHDFTIADRFGIKAIKDTYKRAFTEWKNDIRYLAELTIALNRKCWDHYFNGNEKYSKLYAELFYKVKNYAYENFEGEEISFYFDVTD